MSREEVRSARCRAREGHASQPCYDALCYWCTLCVAAPGPGGRRERAIDMVIGDPCAEAVAESEYNQLLIGKCARKFVPENLSAHGIPMFSAHIGMISEAGSMG